MKPVQFLVVLTLTASGLSACRGHQVEVLSGPSASSSPSGSAATPAATAQAQRIRGVVTAIDSAARSIVLGSTTIAVPAAATIQGSRGLLTFADLKVGDQVVVSLTMAGATLTATAVLVVAEASSSVDVLGRVTTVSGTCPTLTVTVGGASVTTSSATAFDVACAHVVQGAPIAAYGVRQADGTVAASRVVVGEVEVGGPIAGLTGSCPAVSFTLQSKPVSADETTDFEGAGCDRLANGSFTRAIGYLQADGTLAASSVATFIGHPE